MKKLALATLVLAGLSFGAIATPSFAAAPAHAMHPSMHSHMHKVCKTTTVHHHKVKTCKWVK